MSPDYSPSIAPKTGALCALYRALALVLWLGFAQNASAISIPNYSSAANDRFSSGYDTTPVTNTNSVFVGLGYDWSGVGWNSANNTQNFGMISPRHYIVAAHYGGAPALRFFGANGQLFTATQDSVRYTNLGPAFSGAFGDVAVGTLTARIPASAQVAYYSILDLVPSIASPSYNSYPNQNVLMYGWTARVAQNTTAGVEFETYGYSIHTGTAQAAYQGGDSGSPIFIPWTDIGGAKLLTILGHAWAISPTDNFDSLLPEVPVARALNGFMATEGYALRWVGNTSGTWTGASSGKFSTSSNWTPHAVPSDSYILFNGATATNRSISLSGTQNARGMAFKNAAGNNGFTVQNGNLLTIGRGGIRNLDADNAQSILCDVALNDAQWWDGGAGGLVVSGSINTNGWLLIVDGSGNTSFSGVITGSGGLAKEGEGTLALSGSSDFGGTLFVHRGTVNITGSNGNGFGGATVFGGNLMVSNTAGSATGIGPVWITASGTLGGSGIVVPSAGNNVTIDGLLSPGNSVTTGTLQFALTSGSLVLSNSATLVLKSGTARDLVRVNGSPVVLGGTLQIVPAAGFSYASPMTVVSGLSAPSAGAFAAVSGLAAGYTPVFDMQGANYIVTFQPTTYALWQQTHFTPAQIASGMAADTADPNGNGIPNLMEYALGLDPLAPSASGRPTVDASGTYLTLTVPKNPYATDLLYTVEATDDLASGAWNTTETTVLADTATTLIVRDNIPITGSAHRFLRLRVTRQ